MLRHARRQVLRRLASYNPSVQCRGVHISCCRSVQSNPTVSRFSTRIRYTNPLSVHIRRSLVTVTGEAPEEDWERTTRVTLDETATPLGTMTEIQIENAFAAINYWLSPGNYLPSAYDVLRADRLLQRLVYEHASGTMATRNYTATLTETNAAVLQTWFSFGSYLMALEHADIILFRMIDWYHRGLIEHVSPHDFHTLAELWLDQNTIETTSHVADLLIWWTNDPEAKWVSPPDISPLFHKALQHLHAANDQKVAQPLLERMEELQTEWGWEDISPRDDIETSLLENESLSDAETAAVSSESQQESIDAGDGTKMLSSFELATMRQSFLDFVETAGGDDADKVEEWVKRWSSLPNHDQTDDDLGTTDIYKALVEYFLRVQDPKRATKWLQRVGQVPSSGEGFSSVDKLYNILRLWAQSSEREAPWRAQELVQRIEELDAQGELQIGTPTYNLLCEAWLNSGEPVAAQKVLEVVTRMINSGRAQTAPDIDTCHLILRSMEEHKTVDATKLYEMVLTIIKQQWNNMEEQTELQSLLEKTTDTLCRMGMGQQAENLIRQAIKQKMTITPSICENALKAHVNSRQAKAAVKTLDYLEKADQESPHVSLSFECYEIALASLINSGLKGSSEKEKELLSRLLDRSSKGDLVLPPSSNVDRFLTWILYRMRSQHRAFDAHRMLQLMESKLLGADSPSEIRLPVDCFNHVLQALAQAGALNKVEEMFARLLGYYNSGNDQLMPTTASFSIYISSITKEGKAESAEKAERVLEQMIDVYQMSGKEECKPDEGIFNTVLIAWKQSGTEQAVSRSMALLERMLSLGIQPETFTFNSLMATVNRSQLDDKYSKVVELMDRMVELGLDPNSHTYNVLINACANAKNDRESALNRAVEAMGSVRKLGVDMATYPTFLKALRALLSQGDDRRDKLVGSAFQLCCTDGFLTSDLEEQFRKLLSRGAWESLYNEKVRNGTIPQEWSRNVKGVSRR